MNIMKIILVDDNESKFEILIHQSYFNKLIDVLAPYPHKNKKEYLKLINFIFNED